MVSWRIYVYIPFFICLLVGWHKYNYIFLGLSLLLLAYGIFKIATRSCFRKYFTFALALLLVIMTLFKLQIVYLYYLIGLFMIFDIL
jgi:hypothetical protein